MKWIASLHGEAAQAAQAATLAVDTVANYLQRRPTTVIAVLKKFCFDCIFSAVKRVVRPVHEAM